MTTDDLWPLCTWPVVLLSIQPPSLLSCKPIIGSFVSIFKSAGWPRHQGAQQTMLLQPLELRWTVRSYEKIVPKV